MRHAHPPAASAPHASQHPRKVGLAVPLLALALAATILGCATAPPTDPPEITLVDLESAEVTLFETTLVAVVRITNPTPEPLVIEGGAFKLLIEGKKVGRGMTSATFTIPRLESALVEVPFHVNNASAILRISEITRAHEVAYGISGSLYVAGPYGTEKVRVDRSGRLGLQGGIPTVNPE